MDRRAHYLDTALQLFTERGFHGVSVDQIVAEAGGSKATLYRYFSSKRTLFEAIIDDLGAGLPETLDAELDELPLHDALVELGHRVASAALSERAIVLLRLAVGESARFPDLGRILFERGPALSYRRLARLIEARVASGEIDVEDAEIAAEQFLSGIVGHQQLRMLLGISAPSRSDIEARVGAAAARFVRSYTTNLDSSTETSTTPAVA